MRGLMFWKRNRKRRALILAVIANKGPVYALVITDKIASRTTGNVKLKAGGIYPSLRRYEMRGWVNAEARKVAEHPKLSPITHYTIIDNGRGYLKRLQTGHS